MTSKWLNSTEIRKVLKLSGCELMHLRVSGELVFKKVGNAFYYQLPVTNQGENKPDAPESR